MEVVQWKQWQRWGVRVLGMGTIVYAGLCFSLYFGQRYLIYRPRTQLAATPDDPIFRMPYREVSMAISGTDDRLQGWWFPAPSQGDDNIILPHEPANILKTPKTILYLYGVGRNMGDYNYISRVEAFRQLGFSTLVFDYRGYGRSDGRFPREQQFYEDSEAAWNYLRDVVKIPSDRIIIYGESLGGAIAIDLAVKHPEAGGLIVQSSFTSLVEVARSRQWLRLFPVRLLLTEKFDSLAKVPSLQVPVLFLHGTEDAIVPPASSRELYDAAPFPKQIFLISGGGHVSIYQSGNASYLRAIERFILSIAKM